MSFKLGDIIWDRLQYGYAESLGADALPLYLLTQLQEMVVNVTSEAQDVLDKDGNLVKKIYKAKNGNVEGQNAMINTNIVAAASGTAPIFATDLKKIRMPRIITVGKGEKIKLDGFVTGTVKVCEYLSNGNIGTVYKLGEAATATDFAVAVGGDLTLPTAAGVEKFVVKYDREVSDGALIQNRADKFPKSVRLILKGLYFDPCEKNLLKPGYIEIPSFQISPEISLPIQTEATLDFKGDMELDYCGKERVLYNMYLPNEEEII